MADAEPTRGSPAAVLAAMRAEPHLSAEDMDELERSINSVKTLPASGDIFDDSAG